VPDAERCRKASREGTSRCSKPEAGDKPCSHTWQVILGTDHCIGQQVHMSEFRNPLFTLSTFHTEITILDLRRKVYVLVDLLCSRPREVRISDFRSNLGVLGVPESAYVGIRVRCGTEKS